MALPFFERLEDRSGWPALILRSFDFRSGRVVTIGLHSDVGDCGAWDWADMIDEFDEREREYVWNEFR